jgi:hypothetical protein
MDCTRTDVKLETQMPEQESKLAGWAQHIFSIHEVK